MTTVLSRFGTHCRALRSAKNLTMGDQARHMGLPVHEISAVECGLRTPSEEYVESFRAWLSLDQEDFNDLKRKIQSNVIDLTRIKSTGKNGRSIRFFRKISNMNPAQIRNFRKPPKPEVKDGG
ncbi:helix-turn-helix domain-containing protein [Bradyrhizobium centrosematis]|uniref:helix-turn-helix domain-containing protein n=1 Tax=Bradyrhizobium centrosematis TaxID=1300039 RepID=UPI00216A32A4|nr:helix-turn-helix transcriptional regulator [Bradyrhizobium centrosematis]MCS3759338.1 transcriptional regulator with XRE-family HTH domain [Bradyrhizobium centrosematis]MCS3772772.1 transcriptional regulator with XRE-family HTH domain [Bradyrhizobium centrosematis]